MKHLLTRGAVMAVVAIAISTVLCTSSAQAVEIDWPEPNWPEIFEPNQLRTLNLEMNPADWDTICKDGLIWNDANGAYEVNSANPLPYELEVPAWFWMNGEDANKIVVAVRQKSCDPLGDASDRYFKISLKIDINQYYPEDPCAATIWHGLKKLSLENGDDVDVVAEGLGCNLHRMASGPEGYGYDNWHTSWVVLNVNGVCRGVYINAEQHDKQFLRHHDIYISHNSWLYKYWGEGDFELKVGDDDHPVSPAVAALCYEPFTCTDTLSPLYLGPPCPQPDDANFVADMNEYVNMQGMLAMSAVDAFIANPDALFNHNNNAYFHDFNLLDVGEVRKRMYFPWDVDSLMNSVDWDIYDCGSNKRMYEEIVLGSPTFRSQYNQIMRDLLGGPLSFADINDFLDMVEPVLTDALAADPYNQFDSPGTAGVAEHFDAIRTWYSNRIVNVLAQVEFDEPTPLPGIVLLDDGFEGAVWDANWTGGGTVWLKDTVDYVRGSASATVPKNQSGSFTSIALDTSDATAIHIDFWCMKDDTEEAGDFALSYYNGTSYVGVCDLDLLGVDDEWLHYTDTITDSQYFVADFKIQFNATLGNNEQVWVDDVTITKEIAETPCDAANLDGTGLVDFKDLAILANDWWLTGPSLAGDIDANDVVNFGDLGWMFDYWLNDCGQ